MFSALPPPRRAQAFSCHHHPWLASATPTFKFLRDAALRRYDSDTALRCYDSDAALRRYDSDATTATL
ncbi:hypothetical protein EDB84DRAFT_1557977 [Lactarius hengduanensis]|nr:hypothetical protein EDB84DRAFT_1557977 [Lactarius hengduanensis]